jgi:hypothetical protein
MKSAWFVLLPVLACLAAKPALAAECAANDCYCEYEAGLTDIANTYGNDVAAAKPRVTAVKQELDECLSPGSTRPPSGPLGPINGNPRLGPNMRPGGPSETPTAPGGLPESEITLTREAPDVAMQRWRDAKRTVDSAPPHDPRHDVTDKCLKEDWQKPSGQFEYGRLYNACPYPIHVAYCSIGIDCEANKGAVRTLEHGEATQLGDRDHKHYKAHACTGPIHPIGQLTHYSCE